MRSKALKITKQKNLYGVHIICLYHISKIRYQLVKRSHLLNVLMQLKGVLEHCPHYLYCPPFIPKLTVIFFLFLSPTLALTLLMELLNKSLKKEEENKEKKNNFAKIYNLFLTLALF